MTAASAGILIYSQVQNQHSPRTDSLHRFTLNVAQPDKSRRFFSYIAVFFSAVFGLHKIIQFGG